MATVEINTTDIVAFLGKERAAFTKADIKRFVKAKGIRHVNFMYPGGDEQCSVRDAFGRGQCNAGISPWRCCEFELHLILSL